MEVGARAGRFEGLLVVFLITSVDAEKSVAGSG